MTLLQAFQLSVQYLYAPRRGNASQDGTLNPRQLQSKRRNCGHSPPSAKNNHSHKWHRGLFSVLRQRALQPPSPHSRGSTFFLTCLSLSLVWSDVEAPSRWFLAMLPKRVAAPEKGRSSCQACQVPIGRPTVIPPGAFRTPRVPGSHSVLEPAHEHVDASPCASSTCVTTNNALHLCRDKLEPGGYRSQVVPCMILLTEGSYSCRPHQNQRLLEAWPR